MYNSIYILYYDIACPCEFMYNNRYCYKIILYGKHHFEYVQTKKTFTDWCRGRFYTLLAVYYIIMCRQYLYSCTAV